MPSRRTSVIGLETAAVPAPRTRSRTPNKKAAATPTVTLTDYFPSKVNNKVTPTTQSLAAHDAIYDAASGGAAFINSTNPFSRSSSVASTPALQTPAVSAPPTPTPHTNGRRGANNQPSVSNDSAHVAAMLHDIIVRTDNLADLSVGNTAQGSSIAYPLAIRRALPTTSAFATADVIKDNMARRQYAVDYGTGLPSDPIQTPVGECNDSGCYHCTHTTHCDCEFVSDIFYDVYENQLTEKRITERSSSSAAAHRNGANSSRSRSQTDGQHGAADLSLSGSSFVSMLNDEDSRSNSYNSAPAALSQIAVTSKTMVGSSTKHLCAKSLLPPFVSRLIRLLDLQPGDTFYDLGCGNGSILFQVALTAGATCVGVELCPHNAQLARDAWSLIRPTFETKLNATVNRRRQNVNVGLPHVEIITGDIVNIITDPAFTSRPRKILLSNLLFPKELTQFIGDVCRKLPKGSMIVCFDDLYPHGRSVARIRDPEAFELFHMVDYKWPAGSVEWARKLEGNFYIHTRK